jgi:hypothetical protein
MRKSPKLISGSCALSRPGLLLSRTGRSGRRSRMSPPRRRRRHPNPRLFKAKAESTPETKQVDQIEVLQPGASTTLTWKRQEDKSHKAIAGPGYYRVYKSDYNNEFMTFSSLEYELFDRPVSQSVLGRSSTLMKARAIAEANWRLTQHQLANRAKTFDCAPEAESVTVDDGLEIPEALRRAPAAAEAESTAASSVTPMPKSAPEPTTSRGGREKSAAASSKRKLAAAKKIAEPIKTALPEFADDSDVPAYDGITWYSNGDGGCEGRTHGRNGTWVIIPTIESDRYFAANHPHGAMSIDDRKEIGTFSTIEEARAACEVDRVGAQA